MQNISAMSVLVLAFTLSSGLEAKDGANQEGFQAARQYTDALLNEEQSLGGKVIEKIDVADYTYVQVAHGTEKFWLATGKVAVKKGDVVSFENAQTMHQFHSKSLKRTFDKIFFVSQLQVTPSAR